MDMLFSALTVTSVSPPPTPQTTLNARMQNFDFQHYITWGGGGGGDCKVFSKN